MHELDGGIPGLPHEVGVDLVGSKKPDPFGPNIFCLPHGDPYVGVDEVGTAHPDQPAPVRLGADPGPRLLVLWELGKYVARRRMSNRSGSAGPEITQVTGA